MKITSKLVLTSAMMATIMGAPIVADASSKVQMKVVNTSALNIRNIQDQTKLVERIGKGSIVEVIEALKNQPGWYYVKTASGKRGVCSGAYLTKVSNTSTQSSSSVCYTSEKLNVRSGAGTSYAVIKTVAKGTKVEKVSEVNGWAKIKLDNNKFGYCSATYLSKSKPQDNVSSSQSSTKTRYVNADFLNIRTGPSTIYNIYTKVYRGDAVKVVARRSDGWSKIDIGGKYYYVSTQYLTDTKPSNTSTSTSKTKTMYVKNDTLNVRTGPSTSYKLQTTLKKGASVSVVEKRNDGWSKINMGGKYYYVSSQYLSESKPSSVSYSYIVGEAKIPTSKISNNSLINVKNALSKVDGKILAPGAEFDYLKALGPLTRANGFVESGVISGGVYSTGIAGGICAGSTAIHNAVVKTGFRVTERRSHSLPSAYVKKGMDAMVTGSLSYRFVNTSNSSVRMRAYVSGGYIVVRFESTKDIKNGYTYVPETSVYGNGKEAMTTVWKMKDGKKVQVHQKFYSAYRKA